MRENPKGMFRNIYLKEDIQFKNLKLEWRFFQFHC